MIRSTGSIRTPVRNGREGQNVLLASNNGRGTSSGSVCQFKVWSRQTAARPSVPKKGAGQIIDTQKHARPGSWSGTDFRSMIAVHCRAEAPGSSRTAEKAPRGSALSRCTQPVALRPCRLHQLPCLMPWHRRPAGYSGQTVFAQCISGRSFRGFDGRRTTPAPRACLVHTGTDLSKFAFERMREAAKFDSMRTRHALVPRLPDFARPPSGSRLATPCDPIDRVPCAG